jgi:aconitate decarboxylase
MVRVQVHLTDGTVLERTQETARGMVEHSLADEDIVGKFEKLVCHVLPEKQMQELRDAVLNLESLDDAALLGRLMVRHESAGDGRK